MIPQLRKYLRTHSVFLWRSRYTRYENVYNLKNVKLPLNGAYLTFKTLKGDKLKNV